MKLKNILFALLASAAFISAQSCLKEQRDLFPKSSSERLQDYAEKLSKTLVSAEKGWIMEYYPEKGQALGGYAYYVKFSETEAEVSYEREPDAVYKSFYKLTFDNGAVLSFDTNNPAMHFFATPSSGEYQAMGGDFEFSVLSISDEKISLRGKRSGNRCDLTLYKSELVPTKYLEKVQKMSDTMRAAIIEGTIGKTEVTGEIDFDTRRITFSYPGKYVDPETKVEKDSTYTVIAPYMYTDEGVHMYEEVKVAGATLRDLMYHSGNNILTNGSVIFYGKLPEDYSDYTSFIGTWTLKDYYGTNTVTIERDATGEGFIMKGYNKNFDIVLGYNKAKGRATINTQNLGKTTGNNYVMLCAWDADAGYLTWLTEVGMEIYRDINDATGCTFRFCDNKAWETYKCNSFILYEFDGAGKTIGAYTQWGEYRFPNLETLVRK